MYLTNYLVVCIIQKVYIYRHVELPDGRVQRVKYRVSKYSGFVAQVSYEERSNFAPAPKYESVPDYIPRKLPKDTNSMFNYFG